MERDKKNKLICEQALRVQKSPAVAIPVEDDAEYAVVNASGKKKPAEIDGPKGLEPTRYGDWEQKGRCTDF